MSARFSKVGLRYGAPMGRVESGKPDDGELCLLHRVPLNSGGYDSGGAYWGHEKPLWRLQFDEGERYVRAPSRFSAFLAFCEVTEDLGVESIRVRP